MAQEKFDAARFGSQYDRNEPLDLARFQRTVEEFMVLLRSNELRFPNDQGLLDEFCKFIASCPNVGTEISIREHRRV